MTETIVGIGERDASRTGDWICTATGRKFWPLDPRPEDFDIEDIAHAGSQLCRFNGHCRFMYSINQHAIDVMFIVRRAYQLMVNAEPLNEAEREWLMPVFVLASKVPLRIALSWALMHDATEVYVSDVPRPLKHSPAMIEYRDAERNVEGALLAWLGIDMTPELAQLVKWADNIALANEARALMSPESVARWHLPTIAHPDFVYGVSERTSISVYAEFRSLYDALTTRTKHWLLNLDYTK